MRSGTAVLLVGILLMPGCRTAHDVADSSYQAATAPVAPVRQTPPGTATVTTAPSAPVSTSSVNQPRPSPAAGTSQGPVTSEIPPPQSVNVPQPKVPVEFPTAKPVEGKPGFVYSPSDPTKYVDVSGYAPGSKVKDPYSGKIFLVP
jgi:hypothetical protein